MNFCIPLNRFKQRASALAFIIFPLIYVFAFATHPGLFTPHLLTVQELISRAHQNSLLQFGHMLVTFNNFLVIVCAIHFMKVLEKSAGWHGTIGGLLAILGAVLLAADKGAMCLTMSALDNLSETQFAQMLPGLVAIFSKQGWLVILWGFHSVACRVCDPNNRIAQKQITPQMAKHPVPGGSSACGYSRWNGDHQSDRIDLDVNVPHSLRHKAHQGIETK